MIPFARVRWRSVSRLTCANERPRTRAYNRGLTELQPQLQPAPRGALSQMSAYGPPTSDATTADDEGLGGLRRTARDRCACQLTPCDRPSKATRPMRRP